MSIAEIPEGTPVPKKLSQRQAERWADTLSPRELIAVVRSKPRYQGYTTNAHDAAEKKLLSRVEAALNDLGFP